jgi:hypothetical protein
MPSAIIGHNGFVGQYLCQNLKFDFYFNSENINLLEKNTYDTIVCAAPTGNRIVANKNPEEDFENINKIIGILKNVTTSRFILIGTVDSILLQTSQYGNNRKFLEDFVKQKYQTHNILRLSSLISNNIKKNLLYNIKYEKWLDTIDLHSILQWYPLSHLVEDINYAVVNNIPELNLVSEPILNLDIVQSFAPQHLPKISKKQNNLSYNFSPYKFTRNEIFKYIHEYMKS